MSVEGDPPGSVEQIRPDVDAVVGNRRLLAGSTRMTAPVPSTEPTSATRIRAFRSRAIAIGEANRSSPVFIARFDTTVYCPVAGSTRVFEEYLVPGAKALVTRR